MYLVLAFASEAVNGSETRGGERFFLDFGWLFAGVGAQSLCLGLAMVSLGLSVRRGAPWSRWVASTVSVLVSLLILGFAAGAFNDNDDGLLGVALLILVLPALVPIPFLFWFGARDHFAPRRLAPPIPVPALARSPESRELSDRWNSHG